MLRVADGMEHKTTWRITKFDDPSGIINKLVKSGCNIEVLKEAFADCFIGEALFEGNICLNSGIQGFENIISGISSPTKWDNGNARLGVGDSNTAENASQTDLQASTNKAYVSMVSGYPSRSNQTLSWQSSFDGNTANYAWNEFVVTNNAGTGGVCLNRKVSAQGTKTSGQTWVLTLQITWS